MALVEKYGCQWQDTVSPVEIERFAIRQGGSWVTDGKPCGAGLLAHFKALQFLLWPEDYQNRWTDWILKTLVSERIAVIYGCRDSSKTRTVSKWVLCDYWAFPHNTLTLMTSTTRQGLELRVWGDIKSLWERATARYPQLEGNPVDAKCGLFTDDLGDRAEVRDMRKGIVGVPLVTSEGDYSGMALRNMAGIKQERRRLVGDECFPAGTMIDTGFGPRPIESIQVGDCVMSADGFRTVIGTSVREASEFVEIITEDHRRVVCTREHPILTQSGWKKACELNQSHFIVGADESMQELRQTYSKQTRLQSALLVCLDGYTAGASSNLYCPKETQREHQGEAENEHGQSDETGSLSIKSQCHAQSHGSSTQSQGRKWYGADQGGVATDANVSRGGLELWDQDGQMEWKWDTSGLQSGPCVSEDQTGHRSRRSESQQLAQSQRSGSKEGQIFRGAWVESVKVLKQGDPGFPNSDSDSGRCRVFNLHVEGHHTYSVSGLIVHNCQFVAIDYLKTLYAMNSGEFKGAFLGNMIADNGKALDRIAEPENGWVSLGEVKTSSQWRNKYGGVTLNLVGTDSPNLDPDTPNCFPGMLSKDAIYRASRLPGAKDSIEWWSQIVGIRKSGVVSDRVLTVEMVQANSGFKEVIWNSEPSLKIVGVDAGFGGDECVETYIECGTEVGGIEVVKFVEQKVIPVLVTSTISAEDQIANAVKLDCANWGVPDSNVFIEAGMRATLAISFSRIMSAAINAINFGGVATQRPVSNELYIMDEKTGERRLKTCYEHYSKFVTELSFMVRVLVECGQARKFPLPAAEEFQKRMTRYVYGDRYELETKEEYKKRNSGKSPNWSDSVMIAVEGARRLGFVIQRLADPDAEPVEQDDWLDKEIESQRKLERKRTLIYQ